MKITDKINFKQPKYMLPAILYIPILIASYFIFDLFHVEIAEVQDKNLQTTEFLNHELPDAHIKGGDGIGGKYENMTKSWGKIADHTAIDNIEREDPKENLEQYESKYTEEDISFIDQQVQEKTMAAEASNAKSREEEALAELEKALAEARLRGQQSTMIEAPDTIETQKPNKKEEIKGNISEDSKAVNAISDDQQVNEVVKKVKTTSDYFNTLSKEAQEPKLIKAIIDEEIKAVDGSRVRLRLLDDIEINDLVVEKGTYLYATMSGFSSQRVKGTISSIMVHDQLIKVSLSIYDTDGLEGLYVPSSQFRETSKDVASGAMSGSMNMGNNTSSNPLTQWGMQAMTNAYQKTSNAIGKAIKKNKVKLKYGTFVYIINSKDKRENN